MSGYSDGRRVEYAVVHHLRENGYDTIRGASSKGLADVVAVKFGQVLFVNCKRSETPGPTERADLLRVAAHLPGVGVPLMARKPPRKPLELRRLVTTSVGFYTFEPWLADEAATEQGDVPDDGRNDDPWSA